MHEALTLGNRGGTGHAYQETGEDAHRGSDGVEAESRCCNGGGAAQICERRKIMKEERGGGAGAGVGFAGLLTIVFIALKLCGIIKWSWLWVLSPLWISFIFWAVILTVAVIIARKERSRWRK